jgi:alpha-glucosidase
MMANGQEWWRGAVIYQVYPRSFFDSNGDGIGDLKGITAKLDYIASLGVDGVWLSPFFTSPMADFGYDVADYKGVDPIFGTLADCDEMIAEMHKRGLKLVIDIVLNHSSDKHPWFIESRKDKTNKYADWYVWADPKPDGSPPNNWLSVFGGSSWEFDPQRGQYFYHQFLKEQPDLNIRNPEVQEELLATAKWWLDRGVDGFRMDALPHCIHDALLRDNPPRPVPKSDGKTVIHPYSMQWHTYDKTQPEMIPFLKKFRALTDQYKDCMLVAEVNDDKTVETTISYTNGPEMLHTAYDFSLLVHEYSAAYLRRKVEEFFATPHDSWPSWALSNHDSIRVATRWAVDDKPDVNQTKMLLAMLSSLRGSSFVYQGEELGLTEAVIPPEKRQDPGIGSTGTGRDGCRTPMPWDGARKNAGFTAAKEGWLPVPAEHAAASVAAQEKDPASMLNFTKQFLKWRKKHPALLRGELAFENLDENVVAFTRKLDGETLFCAFNLKPAPVTVALQSGWTPLTGYGLQGTAKGQSLELPGFGGFFARKTA